MEVHGPIHPGTVLTIQSIARMVSISPVLSAPAGQMRARPTFAKSHSTKGISASIGNWECMNELTPSWRPM